MRRDQWAPNDRGAGWCTRCDGYGQFRTYGLRGWEVVCPDCKGTGVWPPPAGAPDPEPVPVC